MLLLFTLAGCGGTPLAEVAEDPGFRDCVSGAGVQIPDDPSDHQADELAARQEVMGCLATAADDEQRAAVVNASFDEDSLVDALTEYVRQSDTGPGALAEQVGTVLGAYDDGSVPSGNLAWEVYTADGHVPAGYDAWLAGQDASVADDPDRAAMLYVGYLSEQPSDSDEYATWLEIDRIQTAIDDAR